MKSMYKFELAQLMGVSSGTMTAYMHYIEHMLPHYHRTQKLLTPDQVKVIKEHFCIIYANIYEVTPCFETNWWSTSKTGG